MADMYKIVAGVPVVTDAATFLAAQTLTISGKTSSWTLTADDYAVEWTSGTANATLPACVAGKPYIIANQGTGIITLVHAQPIDGNTSGTITLNQYESISIIGNAAGTKWIIL
jgi:hypothetical protein